MYRESEELRSLAEAVMEEHPDVSHLKEFGCRIAYFISDKMKKSSQKIVFADTEKVKEKYKALVDYDFIITFYEPCIQDLSDKAIKILMYHELMHIGYDGDKCKIIPHDTEDFKRILELFGVNWIEK